MLQFHTVFALAFAISVTLVMVLRPVALRVGLMDVPDARKNHHGPVPLIGGLAVFLTVAIVHSLPPMTDLPVQAPAVVAFLLAGVILAAIGVADDFVELSASTRFVAQIIAALVMVYAGDIVLADLGQLTGDGPHLLLGVLAIPFTVFATVGVINALNMCDGLDGLSGTQTVISLVGFAVAVGLWGDASEGALLASLAGAVAGFLLFNLRLPGLGRAAIFLGDAGSMFLGFALTWFAISLSQGPDPVLKPAAALWFILVPIIDAVAMMLRRLVKKRSPFAPDREHLHHIFQLAGFSVGQTVAIMAVLGGFGVAIGLLSTWLDLPDLMIAGGFLVVGLLYFWMIMHAWRVMRFLRRSICRRRSTGSRERRVLPDRRVASCANYAGPERRTGADRRTGLPRRTEDAVRCRTPVAPPRIAQPLMARDTTSQASGPRS